MGSISKREQLFYIHSQKKNSKKKLKKKILSATFQIFSKCHFLSNGEGVCGQQAISGPNLPTYIELSKKHEEEKIEKKFKKKIQKKSKSNSEKTIKKNSKCHFLSHGEDVSGHQAVNGLPYQLTSN